MHHKATKMVLDLFRLWKDDLFTVFLLSVRSLAKHPFAVPSYLMERHCMKVVSTVSSHSEQQENKVTSQMLNYFILIFIASLLVCTAVPF